MLPLGAIETVVVVVVDATVETVDVMLMVAV